ncbi:MAG TPA: hypothetical protein VKU00_14255 [Chthonomonadaceae bacterium]|nr:hypothetical protein [Chthonomonadaceae bacterium]
MASQASSQDPLPKEGTPEADATPLLAWQVHLLRRYPQRLPILIVTLLLGAGCVWMVFHHPLPVLAAVLLLLGSVREYLFPVDYWITTQEASARGPGLRGTVLWKEVRRCLREKQAVTLTPLAKPSRLDAFRGVTLRFAPKGQPGDRASVLQVVARCAPELIPDTPGSLQAESEESTPTEIQRGSA